MEFEHDSSSETIQLSSDHQLVTQKASSEPKWFSQHEFTALIKNLSMSKDKT